MTTPTHPQPDTPPGAADERLYQQVVDASLDALIETGKLDSGRTSYAAQCAWRRRYIKRMLRAQLGAAYSQADYDAWNAKQYRCGW